MGSTTTTELNMIKPDDDEQFDVAHANGNMNILDALFNAMSGHAHAGAHQGAPITSAGLESGITIVDALLTDPHFVSPVVDSGPLTIASGQLIIQHEADEVAPRLTLYDDATHANYFTYGDDTFTRWKTTSSIIIASVPGGAARLSDLGTPLLTVPTTGPVLLANGLSVSTGGITITTGGLTINGGGLRVGLNGGNVGIHQAPLGQNAVTINGAFITASGGNAAVINIGAGETLQAAANGDYLYGMYVAPTFDDNAHTGVHHVALRADSSNTALADVVLGAASIGNTATSGFVWITSGGGAPTGVPAGGFTGLVPLRYDSANHKLWAYEGGSWKGVVLA